jgi:hypothetical protein
MKRSTRWLVERALARVSDSFQPLLVLLAESGIRLSEGLGLRWPDWT